MRGEKRRVAKSRELMRLKLKGKNSGRKNKLNKHLFIFMPLDWGTIAGIIVSLIAVAGVLWRFAVWYGGLREWRKKIDEWKTSLGNLNLERWMGSTDTKLDMLTNSIKELKGSIEGLKTTVEIIKETIERETMDGMVSRQSPLVASEKAIEVLRKVNLMSEIDKNCDFILAEVDKKSKLFIYTDLKTPEERITGIAPSIVHELIKAGKIEEKKVDLALKELEKIFGANAATYYGVLLLITAYILEKKKERGELYK